MNQISGASVVVASRRNLPGRSLHHITPIAQETEDRCTTRYTGRLRVHAGLTRLSAGVSQMPLRDAR
jgi:hypothetical protein